MFDQKLFQKIIACQCSLKELEAFGEHIDQMEFDTENAFVKYYHLNHILHGIHRYQNKTISQKYLTHWANAYHWIVMGGFKEPDDAKEPLSLKILVKWMISDWLDSLSFFDKKYCDTDDYIRNFCRLDLLYQSAEQWRAVYTLSDPEIIDICCLLINDTTKKYDSFDMNGFLNAGDKIDATLCNKQEWDQLEKQLIQNGYTEL